MQHVLLGAKTGNLLIYFQDVGKVCGRRFNDNFITEQENKATLQKTQRNVKRLVKTFL